jgi:tetratricopeptide (TPR) repeat protein
MVSSGSPEAGTDLVGGGSRRRRWAVWAVVALLVAAGAAAAVWWRPRGQPPVDPFADLEEFAEPPARSPGYLGPRACAACHAQRVADFQKTNHFRACRLPRDGDMPAGFAPGKGSHRTLEPGLRFEMNQEDGAFFQTAIHETPAGEQRSRARIDLVYGAARADEVFFSWRGDRLYELPVVWLHPLNAWGNTSLNRYGKGDFSREATTRCLECHNTWLEHVPGTANQYRRDNFIRGVTCESCHGPGREHVGHHQKHPRARAHAVVHPGRLNRERQLEVCTQCHSNANRARGPAFNYRPGEPLDAYFRPALNKHPENDHVANQVKYLRRSKCFQNSDTLTCTTCHNPHKPYEASHSSARRSCLKCHAPEACGDRPRLPVAVRDDCVGCHMPARVWMNVHFHTEDDRFVPPIRRYEHRIAVHPVARQEVLLAWYRKQADAPGRLQAERLREGLVKHWLAEAEARRREYRFLAAIGAIREALRIDPAPDTRARLHQATALQAGIDAGMVEALHQIETKRFSDAVGTLQKVLRVKPDFAVAQGRLGTAYAALEQRDLAVKHLGEVARDDPDDPYGEAMLGWLAFLDGRWAAAAAAYRRADQIEPFNPKTTYHWGLSLLKLGRPREAGERFELLLRIDPRHAGGCQGLAHALRQQGQPARALPFALRAARLTRLENADVLLSLAETFADAGRFAEARKAAQRALEAARASNPRLVGRIRRALQEMQGSSG